MEKTKVASCDADLCGHNNCGACTLTGIVIVDGECADFEEMSIKN
jgi:hypothetical protein